MEEKVYYEETLRTGEIVTVTDSYVRCRKPYRRKNKEGYKMDKIIPLDTVTKVSRKPDLVFALKNIFVYSLMFALLLVFCYFVGYLTGAYVADYYYSGGGNLIVFAGGVDVLELIEVFFVGLVIAVGLTSLLSFVGGIYVAGDKACFYVITENDNYKKIVEAIDLAKKENVNQ